MDMIAWLEHWLATDDTKIIYVLILIAISNIIDFSMGWINAKFNPEVEFSSSVAILGIARKIILFILLVVFIPFALLLPDTLGIGALYVLYLGYLASEFISILNHLKMTNDNKSTEVFYDFIEKFFKGGK